MRRFDTDKVAQLCSHTYVYMYICTLQNTKLSIKTILPVLQFEKAVNLKRQLKSLKCIIIELLGKRRKELANTALVYSFVS